MANPFEEILNIFGGEGGKDVKVPNIPLPVLKELNPELYKQVVSLNPELEQAVNLGPSQMEGISLDPRYKQAQMDALSRLMDISANGGQDAQFKADSAKLQDSVNTNLQGNSQAIQQNMAARGMSGGMSEMVNKQLAAQQAANRQAQMGLDIQAQAQQRALQALMGQSDVASRMEQSDYSMAANKAQAQDAISRFNAQNQQQVSSNNADRRNQAQQFNAQNAQNTANQNVSLNNQAKEYNLGLAQQNFENQMARAGLSTGIDSQNQARRENRRGQNLAFTGSLISGGAQAFGGGGK